MIFVENRNECIYDANDSRRYCLIVLTDIKANFIQVWYNWYIVRTFVKVKMHPHPENQ
jgi:hypothetical protein